MSILRQTNRDEADRFIFIKNGAFSHTNAQVKAQLVAAFPHLHVETVDVWNDLLHGGYYLLGLVQSLLVYGKHLTGPRQSFRANILRTPLVFRQVQRMMRQRLGGDRVHCRFTFQTQSIFDASVAGIPHFVFTDHTHFANLRYPAFHREDLFPARWTDLEREVYHHAQHIFVMSDHMRASLCEDYGVEDSRVSTVYGGSNIDPTPAALENDGFRNRTVIFVGVEWERKGGRILAEAFARMRTEVPDARLIVVGCRPHLGQPWCEEVGQVPRAEVKRHLARASVLCLPTLIEPFGIAVIEAFSQGLPAVVSDVGAMPSVVRDGKSGSVVPAGDASALASALKNLLTDPAKCRAWGEAGRRDASERYSWPIVGQKLSRQIRLDAGC